MHTVTGGNPALVELRLDREATNTNQTEDNDVDALTYDLLKMTRYRGEGSFATQANRKTMLKQMAAELKAGGFGLTSAASLKPKHIEYLLQRWQEEQLSPRTIKNRMGVIRWWADGINKRSMLKKRNEDYGIIDDEEPEGTKADTLTPAQLDQVQCPLVRASLELQAAFGLRREEAIKFTPAAAIGATAISLKASWTKGGRPRQVPIITEEQRQVLTRAAAVAGKGSLIQAGSSYVAQMRRYDRETARIGVHGHGLRHAYAQRRYEDLTGWPAPAAGGKLPESDLERHIDEVARRQVSQELGHNRIAITKVYLG